MPKWNIEQQKAIETKQKNILVSASAGSGKTTVLIARLMDKVMKEHISIDAICAMTFTEAAANEMKKRLAIELQEANAKAENADEKAFITKQLTNIQTAHISTIHSFCLSILQDYYYVIGLSERRIANVMDPSMMKLYQSQALKEAFSLQYAKQDASFLAITQMFSSRPENNDALCSMIQSLATLSYSKSNSEQWLSSLPSMYENVHSIKELPQNIQDYFFSYLQVECKRYDKALTKLLALYTKKYFANDTKLTLIKEKEQSTTSLFKALNHRNYNSYRQAFINVSHLVVPTAPDKEDSEYIRLRKTIQTIEDSMLAILFSEDEYMRDLASLENYTKKLVEMCMDYCNSYAALKAKHEMIDFDDMEHFAIKILQANNGEVANIYREQFVEIMVDEFQDSNDVQNTLVNLICRKNNVFRVGDIKQSIYGFRHALPTLMKELIAHKGEDDEVIYLSNNYRSKQTIVDFNNILFKKLMNMEGFSSSYSAQDNVKTGIPSQQIDNVPICFHAIFHEDIKKEEHLLIAKNTLKANYIANQIVEIHDCEHRPWKDFVVLVRGNARKDDIKAAFDELHIPYFIDIKYGFYQSSSVQIMLSALKALCNPHNDIAFCALMMSPLFLCSAQDFTEAKLHKDKHESYYHYFKNNPFLSFSSFEELYTTFHQFSLSELLNALYDVNDYYSEHTTLQEKTNLDLLFDKAVHFEQTNARGVEAFLSQIEQIQDAQTAEAIPIGSDADIVRVMSIHQSKGLQFPVVFLWSTDRQTPIEFKDFCICDGEQGIAMKAMDLPKRFMRTTIPRIAMEHKKNKEELEEEMRILYVATTRAQEQMHIVDCVLSLEPYEYLLTMSDIYDRNGYTAWILQIFLHKKSSLFTLKKIHHLWKNKVQDLVSEAYRPLTHYAYETASWQFITASQTKAKKLPAFLYNATKGTQYGTHMHKMIELMQNDNLNDEALLDITASMHFELRTSDIATLHALHEDKCYQKAQQGECFYELPYTVHDGNEILHGYMDFVSIMDTNIMIVDFKTDALNNEEEFIALYKEQLATYQRAMHILYPNHSIQTFIYSLHKHLMITVQS